VNAVGKQPKPYPNHGTPGLAAAAYQGLRWGLALPFSLAGG